MPQADIEKFIQLARNDEALMAQVKELFQAEPRDDNQLWSALISLAASRGFTFTADELETVANDLELTEEELEMVAGGTCINTTRQTWCNMQRNSCQTKGC